MPSSFLPTLSHQMEWTDRHYRFLMRGITRHTQLYTEMVVDSTVRAMNALGVQAGRHQAPLAALDDD